MSCIRTVCTHIGCVRDLNTSPIDQLSNGPKIWKVYSRKPKAMQEYKRQIDRESRWASNGSNGSPNGDGIQAIGRSSHKMIEAVMQSAAKGKVELRPGNC